MPRAAPCSFCAMFSHDAIVFMKFVMKVCRINDFCKVGLLYDLSVYVRGFHAFSAFDPRSKIERPMPNDEKAMI